MANRRSLARARGLKRLLPCHAGMLCQGHRMLQHAKLAVVYHVQERFAAGLASHLSRSLPSGRADGGHAAQPVAQPGPSEPPPPPAGDNMHPSGNGDACLADESLLDVSAVCCMSA